MSIIKQFAAILAAILDYGDRMRLFFSGSTPG